MNPVFLLDIREYEVPAGFQIRGLRISTSIVDFVAAWIQPVVKCGSQASTSAIRISLMHASDPAT